MAIAYGCLWPEPTPLQSTTDRNQTVRLHDLCTVCRRLVDEFQRLISDPLLDDALFSYECYSTERKHYQSSLELAASSENGCHLCSILWAQLQAKASELESLRLLESNLEAAFMTVPHSYALRMEKYRWSHGDANLYLYYPPKRHESGESEDLWSLIKPYLTNGHPREISMTKMHLIPSQDFPQYEDSATVSTASERTFSLALGWLRDCLASHRLCNQTPDADFAPPTRVIDISTCGGQLLPRLYLSSSEDLNMKYVALSYCWGESNTAILEERTLGSMIDGIEWSQLPKTFQDAIYVTRRLGFRYLWIDSLCIIQDSPEDWSKESGTMHNVYANCVFTIAASWGKDSSTGLFIERKPLYQQPCRIFKDRCTGTYIQPNVTDPARFSIDHNVQTLEKRAWAVQERYLPARILSYRSFELQWDCLESPGSESWPTRLRRRAEKKEAERIDRPFLAGEWIYRPGNTALRQISLLKPRTGRFDLDYMIDFYSHWNDILQIYTRARLTVWSDVLVAFSGITKNVEKWTGLTNIFGMWKELLPLDLLWERKNQGYQTIRYASYPTWSWAAWVGIGGMISSTDSCTELYNRELGDPVHVKARVISLDPPSAVSGSHMKIEIQGPMFCTKILSYTKPAWNTLEGIERTICELDSPDEHLSGENVFCLLIMELSKPDLLLSRRERLKEEYNRVKIRTKVGLILSHPEREKEEYIRIGVWRQVVRTSDTREWEEKYPILNMEEKTIFLI